MNVTGCFRQRHSSQVSRMWRAKIMTNSDSWESEHEDRLSYVSSDRLTEDPHPSQTPSAVLRWLYCLFIGNNFLHISPDRGLLKCAACHPSLHSSSLRGTLSLLPKQGRDSTTGLISTGTPSFLLYQIYFIYVCRCIRPEKGVRSLRAGPIVLGS